MFPLFVKPCIFLPIIAASVSAGPKIEFNVRTYNCGTVYEDKADTLHAVFKVKNTGTAPLKLENVRPGCNCTSVTFDSLIQPGKTATIESRVAIKGFPVGPTSQIITITSNAENERTVRLTINARVLSAVLISDVFIALDKSNVKSPRTVTVSSLKADLKVSEVSFKLIATSGNQDWRNISMPITYVWTPTDSIKPDGGHVYKLQLFTPSVDESLEGEFILKTNHPYRPETAVTGYIVK